MVEVDPRLFVTCRLCLDVQGHFQIDPEVQLQIKYCFDIDVEPFDRLPQLICKKCETVLREYHAVKKIFNDKQKELREKVQDNARKVTRPTSSQQSGTEGHTDKAREVTPSTSSQQSGTEGATDKSYSSRLRKSDSFNHGTNITNKRKKKKVKKKRILKRFLSSSEDEVEPNNSTAPQINEKVDIHKSSENSVSWETNYKKRYVCRICSQGFPIKEEVTKHVKQHTILQKHKNVFKMSYLVVMNKCDSKPNLCNGNAVVCSSDCIRQSIRNPFYSIMYFSKTPSDISDNNLESKNYVSDNESRCSEIKTRKRKRKMSGSSSETVVIHRQSEPEDTTQSLGNDNSPTVIDCIDLGDSSDNGSYESNDKSITSKNGTQISKAMQQILKMCYSIYAKQVDHLKKKTAHDDNVNDELLQRKVLSIGRKIINNKGFNCTGLLRFLEYRDLGVQWKETNVLNPSSDDKYVRIATTLRTNETNINEVGWKDLSLSQFDSEETKSLANVFKKLRKFENFRKREKLISNTNEEQVSDCVQVLPRISSVFSHMDLEITKIDSDSVLAKILNENPVSNPKQLPKKTNINESYPKNIRVFSAPNKIPSVSTGQIEEDIDVNCKITPTTSLASLPVIDLNNIDPPADSLNSSQQPHYPRIKVKPDSELLAKEPESSLNSNEVHGLQNGFQITNNIWSKQKVSFTEQRKRSNKNNQNSNVSGSQWPQIQRVSFVEESEVPIEYLTSSAHNAVKYPIQVPITPAPAKVLLNSVQFPNTKTASPIQYFQNMLIVNNITLEIASEPLATPLINLKIIFQYNENETIVIISLLLACLKNKFYMEFKDSDSKVIDVNNLGANWQWQLLKSFNQSEVIHKAIQTAETISLETYQCTRDFFNLLKSIDMLYENT